MRFTSVSFGLFGAILLAAYYHVSGKHQWKLLLMAGMLFYLENGWHCLALILLTALSSFLAARKMENIRSRFPKEQAKRRSRFCLAGCLFLNFGILAFCKFRVAFSGFLLPMGISFYMFQTMGYVLDVYRGREKAEENFFRHMLFVSYFPQLIQGPISKHSQLAPLLSAPHPYDPKQVSFGLQRMLWGYFKKMVIADRIAPAVTALLKPRYTGLTFGVLTLFYAVQIYADFTGGIDIALGFSQALGIALPENFLRPFFSRNIAQYWRRWHITLGTWMKEYVFYPVSVSRPMLRLSKAARKRFGSFGKRLPVYMSTIVTWFITGIWHGLTPNFVLWGMLNCFVIILSEELAPLYQKFHTRFGWKQKCWYGCFEILRTFLLMNLIRACDLFPNVMEYLKRMGSLATDFRIPHNFWMDLGLTGLDYGILGFGIGIMLIVSLLQEKKGSVRELLWNRPVLRYFLMTVLFLMVLLMGSYGVGYDGSSFIYNRF